MRQVSRLEIDREGQLVTVLTLATSAATAVQLEVDGRHLRVCRDASAAPMPASKLKVTDVAWSF
jgi:hypothetical protein